ncbi:MAG: hypothetical protein ABH858_07140, partial [Candidatus Omnitrophota bacterium]
HAASVHPEPGSNSQNKHRITQNFDREHQWKFLSASIRVFFNSASICVLTRQLKETNFSLCRPEFISGPRCRNKFGMTKSLFLSVVTVVENYKLLFTLLNPALQESLRDYLIG